MTRSILLPRSAPLVLAASVLALVLGAGSVCAQNNVVRDGSLGAGRNEPVPSQVDENGIRNYEIGAELGSQAGANLFHSFRDFNLDAHEIATFSGPDSVQNIIARVTGGPSSLDGTLRSTIPGSNLYFLNPAGILFGSNARLDIPGSFAASTASQLRFDDGTLFDTGSSAPAPLLTSAPLSAFGFLRPEGPIDVQGSYFDGVMGSFALIGADVTISDATFLEGIYGPGSILIVARPTDTLGAGKLSVSDSMFTIFGESAGKLFLNAAELTLSRSNLAAIDVNVDVAGRLTTVGDVFPSIIFANQTLTLRAAELYLNDVELAAPSQLLEGQRFRLSGAFLGSQGLLADEDKRPTFITLRAGEEIVLTDDTQIEAVSAPGELRSTVTLETSRVVIENGAKIRTAAVLPRIVNGGYALGAGLLDSGGTILIDADQVTLRTGGRIDSSTLSRSGGGSIDIAGRDFVEIEGPDSGVFAVAGLDGAAGQVRISAPRVTIRDGATVSTETTIDPSFAGLSPAVIPGRPTLADVLKMLPAGQGHAGVVSVEGDSISIESGGKISSATDGTGAGGTIHLNAHDSLSITGGASVLATSTGPGKAGRVELEGGARLRLKESLVSTSSLISAGGDILIRADAVDIDHGTVSTNVGPGKGGNIEIEGRALALRSGSQVVARAKEGTGGAISIRSRAFLQDPSSVVDASSDFGVDGTVATSSPAADLNASLKRLESSYIDPAGLLVQRCQLRSREGEGSFRVDGRDALPGTPQRPPPARYSQIPAPLGPADRGDIEAFLAHAPGADVDQAPIDAVIRTAEVLEELGDVTRARELLTRALERAEPAERGRLLGLRARLWARGALWRNAERDFSAAERAAEERRDTALLGRVFLDRAGAELERGAPEPARALYARALESAGRAGDADTRARARAALAAGGEELAAAIAELAALAPTHDRLYASLHMALSLAALPGDSWRLRAAEVITRNVEQADDLGDTAAESYAWGYLADLYLREDRIDDALELTRRALAAASRADRPEAIYRWGAQLGRALERAGDLEGATTADALSLKALERLRAVATLSPRAQSDFASVLPALAVSTHLVDVLLARAASSEDTALQTSLLLEARERLEASSRREIRDYFQDECLALEPSGSLDALPDALAIYPVLLQDRAELLISSAHGIQRVRLAVTPADLRREIQSLRTLLEDRTTYEYRAPAARLYEWLIDPVQALLASDGGAERTLVVVPSGPFAAIPFAALYDVKRGQYLIEQHPVAVSPGLSLIEPRALDAGPHAALQVGLTVARADFPALPAAREEIESIHQLFGGTALLDADFVAAALDRELSSKPYEIVHIASHGQFGGDPDSTYIATFDGRIGMSELADLVSRTRFRDHPLELLTLSACQSAAGDERSALGLAGVAVRAGARSTLASLWSANDPATARLMRAFYGALIQSGTSRARALQLAQQSLLTDPVYRHPAYWAPFVLVGSWR